MLLDDDEDDDEGEKGDAVLDEDGENEVDDRDVAGCVSFSLLSVFNFLLCKGAYQKSHLLDSVWRMLTLMRKKMPVRLWVKSLSTLGNESRFTYYTHLCICFYKQSYIR